VDVQRRRLLDAMADIVGEEGYAVATVTAICARAGLSRQTFYRRFDSPQTCFLIVLDEAYEEASRVIIRAFDSAGTWQQGLREAFAALLVLFESRPSLARVWMIESITAGSWALEHRERRVAELTEVIAGHWEAPSARPASHPMVATAVMAAVIAAIQRHLATDPTKRLLDLLGPLMGIATDPFLEPGQVFAEIRAGEQLASEISSGLRQPAGLPVDGTVEIPRLLLHPNAHRARRCISFLSQNPGASNREIGAGSGITAHSQISQLLMRLERLGVANRKKARPGRPNDWTLTAYGTTVAAALKGRIHSGSVTSV
jgi:AcrR family transcriptional regulator